MEPSSTARIGRKVKSNQCVLRRLCLLIPCYHNIIQQIAPTVKGKRFDKMSAWSDLTLTAVAIVYVCWGNLQLPPPRPPRSSHLAMAFSRRTTHSSFPLGFAKMGWPFRVGMRSSTVMVLHLFWVMSKRRTLYLPLKKTTFQETENIVTRAHVCVFFIMPNHLGYAKYDTTGTLYMGAGTQQAANAEET